MRAGSPIFKVSWTNGLREQARIGWVKDTDPILYLFNVYLLERHRKVQVNSSR